MTKKKGRYISPVWGVSSPYYLVRIPAKYKAAQKVFVLSTHGGKRKAFKAAQAWRDSQLKECGVSVYDEVKRIPAKISWGACDIVGIARTNHYRPQPNGNLFHVNGYSVNWTETDKKTGKRTAKRKDYYFKDGDEEGKKRAYDQAVKKRQEMLKGNYERPKT